MLYATELMGAKTYDAQSNYVRQDSRIFFIEPAEQPNRISHYLLSRGEFPAVGSSRHDQVKRRLAPGTVSTEL